MKLRKPKSYEKSFASFEGVTPTGKKKVDCWSSNNELTPRQVFKQSNKKYEFECDVCSHSWKSVLYSVVGQGRWCPYCSNPPKNLCEKKYCILCIEKSFTSFEGVTPTGKKKVDCWSISTKVRYACQCAFASNEITLSRYRFTKRYFSKFKMHTLPMPPAEIHFLFKKKTGPANSSGSLEVVLRKCLLASTVAGTRNHRYGYIF